jgi:phage shock protein C
MVCKHCQRDIAEYSNYCYFCGARQHISAEGTPLPPKRLMRSATDRKIAGVCGGIAEYFEMDSTIVRLVWVLAVLLPIPFVPAFLGYFVGWLVMPKAPLYAGVKTTEPPVIIPNSAQTA